MGMPQRKTEKPSDYLLDDALQRLADEGAIDLPLKETRLGDLLASKGTINWPEDPMDYQRKVRATWD